MFRAVLLAGVPAAVLSLAALPLVPTAGAQEVDVEFTDDLLNDPEAVAQGEAIWKEHCRLCHGQRTGYGGKGPKLQPRRYSPEFVYHRVTFGFRGMPAWKDVYSEEERKAIVAYVLSNRFAD